MNNEIGIKMKIQLASLAVLTAFFAGTATASNLTVPNTFAADTKAVAAEVNANFSAVKTAVDDNQTQIDAVKTTADANTTAIDANTTAVDANTTAIDANTLQIGINTTNVGINSSDISALSTRVDGAAIAVPGNNPGDMQYWDGSAWVLIAAPAPGTTNAKLGFCNDKPSWDCIAVGDTGPAGGIVFYVAADGISGLEAAPADLAADLYEWGCMNIDITGADLTNIGGGAANTADIVAAGCTPETPGNLIAANAADAHLFGGFTDWFLPSKDELNELYLQRAFVGGFGTGIYRSSSESSATSAWTLDFSNGALDSGNGKQNPWNVRPIRTFGPGPL
jgi:hypothetical protein